MGVGSDAAAGRSWAPVGQTPVLKRTGKRFRVIMISAISNAGKLRFRLFVGSFNGPVFIDFLGRLLRDCGGRKVHLIVDAHPVHHAKLVSAWVARHADRIQLHFLPGYSPELNPVELLNHDVKATPRAGGVPARRVSPARNCTGICGVGSASRRSWFASSNTRRPAMLPPHESHGEPKGRGESLGWRVD
jgi:transposase